MNRRQSARSQGGWRKRGGAARKRVPVLVLVLFAVLTACGGDQDPAAQDGPRTAARTPGSAQQAPVTPAASPVDGQRFPDVVDAELRRTGSMWELSATISSPYDREERYADAFRARTPEGDVLGVRELAHPHPQEQPFTRSLQGLAIPPEVDRIVVEGRDSRHGWGGETVTVEVDHAAEA